MNKISNRRLARGFVAHLSTGKSPKKLISMLAAQIVESKQTSQIDLIMAEIGREIEQQKSVVNARVYSARQMSAAVKVEVAQLIKTTSQADKVIIEEQVDPSLLGGVKIEMPETEIDLTVRTKLEKIGGSI